MSPQSWTEFLEKVLARCGELRLLQVCVPWKSRICNILYNECPNSRCTSATMDGVHANHKEKNTKTNNIVKQIHSSCIWGQHGTGQHVLSACSQISTNHTQICTRHRNTHRLKRAAQNAASMYGVASSLFHPQSLSLSRISHIASVPKQHVPYVLCVEHHQTSWNQLGVWFSESACVCPHTHLNRKAEIAGCLSSPKAGISAWISPCLRRISWSLKLFRLCMAQTKGIEGHHSQTMSNLWSYFIAHTQHIKTQAFSVAGVFLRSGKITAGCCIELQTSSKSIEEQLNRFESYRSYSMEWHWHSLVAWGPHQLWTVWETLIFGPPTILKGAIIYSPSWSKFHKCPECRLGDILWCTFNKFKMLSNSRR